MLLLDQPTREHLWRRLIEMIEDYVTGVASVPVSRSPDPGEVRALVNRFSFESPQDPISLVVEVTEGLWKYQVHTPHPCYFGLFNPAPATMGIAADLLVAAFNPQIAAWSHNPLAAEMEMRLVREFGIRFGFDEATVDGTFCSGGAEANHTAILTALVSRFSAFSDGGVRSLEAQPVFYISAHSHHSFVKAARFCGLGTNSVRDVPVNENFQMRSDALEERIRADRRAGNVPFLVVATAGTTSTGAVDDLAGIAETATRHGMWFHVDAAWGGAAAFVQELRDILRGIEMADSITFDAHKWLSVPMGAGIYLTRHPEILSRTCAMTADYMPREASALDIIDPYGHSLQWSRRFIGLKVFLTLASAGWEGYSKAILHQTEMGNELRRKLQESNWRVVNRTPLPVVNFVDSVDRGDTHMQEVVQRVLTSGSAWISTVRLPLRPPIAGRACITNYRTQPHDLDALITALQLAR